MKEITLNSRDYNPQDVVLKLEWRKDNLEKIIYTFTKSKFDKLVQGKIRKDDTKNKNN